MTLAEMIVAVGILLAVMSAVFSAIRPANDALATVQESADVQQRLRVAAEALTADLRMARAVRPYRIGQIGDDAEAGVFFRSGVISVIVPSPMTRGVPAAAAETRTYYLRSAGDGSQLMRYDGGKGDFPMLEDVARLDFEYFGETQPPRLMSPGGAAGPVQVTYGPAPPPLGSDDRNDGWGPGESCTFAVIDGSHSPRLAALGGRAVIALPPEVMIDGPWCPDAADAHRFDADLLRIRRVRVRLRLQAHRLFRGPAGVLFTHAGSATAAARYVPDREVHIDAALRNAGGPT